MSDYFCVNVKHNIVVLSSSSGVNDTLGHTSTHAAFSVDSELLRYFPGHTDAFQILLYGV